MGTWEPVELGLGPLEAVVDGVKTAAQAVSTALAPISALLDVLGALLPSVSEQTLSFDPLGLLSTEVLVVHCYPKQVYQAQRMPAWSETVEASLELSASCINPPCTLFVIAVGLPDPEPLMTAVSSLQTLFDQATTGYLDAPQSYEPEVMLAQPATECFTLADVFPPLRELLQSISFEATVSPPDEITELIDAIALKIEYYAEIIATIEHVLALIADIDLEGAFCLVEDCQSLDDVATVIQAATGGPESTDYIAGSAILADGAGAAILKGLFGVG